MTVSNSLKESYDLYSQLAEVKEENVFIEQHFAVVVTPKRASRWL